MYVLFVFMIFVLMRFSGGVIGILLFFVLLGNIVLLVVIRYNWVKYLLLVNIDLYSILKNGSFIDGVIFLFVLCMLLFYLFVFLCILYIVFLKCDLI